MASHILVWAYRQGVCYFEYFYGYLSHTIPHLQTKLAVDQLDQYQLLHNNV